MTRILLLSILLISQAAQAADALQTMTVAYRDVPLTYSAEGVVDAIRQSTVSAQISGRIAAVNFDVGDTVKKGQVILRIDPSEVDQAFNESSAQLAAANAAFENARANYQRSQNLFQKKFVSQAALDRAKAEYEAAKAGVDARRANVGIAANTKSYANVVAPFSGVVASRLVEPGEMATPGKPLMTGFDPSGLRVTVSVPQYKLAAIEAGRKQGAMIELPALHQTLKATSETVFPVANGLTHTTTIRLDLPANTPGTYPGMYARARFVIGRGNKLLIPAGAVVRRSEVTAVYVMAGGKPSLRQIRLGDGEFDGQMEVLSGLAAGEIIALDPIKAGIMLKEMR